MGTDALTTLFSGLSTLAPRLARAGLSVLMATRLAALATGAKSLWQDEMGDLACNTSASCRLACFDSAFPISPFNLFLLQAAFISAHGLALSYLRSPPDPQGKAGRWKGWSHNRTQQLRLHLLGVVARILLEGIFLTTFHSLYGRYPQSVRCPVSTVCPHAVGCTIRKAGWKDAFNLFMAGTGWASVVVCVMVLYTAITDIFQLTLHPAKRQPGCHLLVEWARRPLSQDTPLV